jgi:hypothetical protein
MLSYYTNIQIEHDDLIEELNRNSCSGIELLLGMHHLIPRGEKLNVSLFGEERDSVELEERQWGAFTVAVSRAHAGKEQKENVALVGMELNENEKIALTLADLDRPLRVCGNTRLKGDCFLPAAGIERAYIEGKSFTGTELVEGKIEHSNRTLPPYNDSLIKEISSLFSFIPAENDSIASVGMLHSGDSISNSFFNRTLYIYSADALSINSSITGNVCIISKKQITIGKNSSLENVLLLAPAIEIEDEVTGTFQAFARDSLKAGKEVRLNYPSVLALISDKNSPDHSTLSIGEKTAVSGQLFACSIFSDLNRHVLIQTAKESLVYGSVYCSDLVDHKGTVIGSLSCSKFLLQTNSAEYENHLLDAVIDRTSLSDEFVAPLLLLNNKAGKGVAEWLE